MTHKHFKHLATLVKDLPATFNIQHRQHLVSQLSVFCRCYNDNFDEARFAAACYAQFPEDKWDD